MRPRPWEAFRERLRELGYVEGQNVAFEVRWVMTIMAELTAELVRLKVDVVVPVVIRRPGPQRITTSITIIMATSGILLVSDWSPPSRALAVT